MLLPGVSKQGKPKLRTFPSSGPQVCRAAGRMTSNNDMNSSAVETPSSASKAVTERGTPPVIPDHELLRRIGGGSYGEVWLAKNVMGTYRAVKVVYRHNFEDAQPFDREFK